MGRAQDPVQFNHLAPIQAHSCQLRSQAATGDQPRLLTVQHLKFDLLQIDSGRRSPNDEIESVVAQLRQKLVADPLMDCHGQPLIAVGPGSLNRCREYLPEMKGVIPICRCAAWPDARVSMSRTR